MRKTFEKIKKEYDAFYATFFAQGTLPTKDTKLGYWGAAAAEDLWELFRRIKLKRHARFLDLGAGDGKVVLVASLFTNAEGIEVDEELLKKATEIKDALHLGATFHQGDYMEHDLSKYDVLFINPDKPMYELEKKLKKEMRKDAKLVVYNALYTPIFPVLEEQFFINGVECRIYRKE